MNSPLISIIVPIYNVEKYLDKCIDSIVNQTYKNLEIILVDDGSNDKSSYICDDWGKKDKRIIVIHKLNGGLSDARNAGLDIAKGEYISFIDSDDFVSIKFIEKLYEYMIITNSDLIQCTYQKVHEQYIEPINRIDINISTYETITSLQMLIKEEKFNQVVWNKLYKREILMGMRFEFGRLNEDEFFTYQVFAKCKRITFINIPLYFYLIRTGSIMNKNFSIHRLDGLEAKFRRYNFLKQSYLELAIIDKKNLIFYIVYCYQKILKIKDNKQKKIGKQIIKNYFRDVMKDSTPIESNFKESIWIALMKLSIEWTATLRNILRINIE